MRFVKENPALAAGIGLPVLLVILFSLAAIIPQMTVAPPEYDVVFTVQDYQCYAGEAKVDFELVKDKVTAKYIYPKKENNYVNCSNNKHIYRFDARSRASREITFEIPASDENSHEWRKLEVPELESLKIDNSPVSPDGYKFRDRDSYYSGGFFLFGGYRSHNGVSIIKGGLAIDLAPANREPYYSYNQANFLGWVVPEGDKK